MRADAMHGHGRDPPQAEIRRYYMAANQTGVVVGKLGACAPRFIMFAAFN